MLIKTGVNPEGENHVRKAIQLDPDDAWAHIYLGSYLWRCADIDAAIAEFQIAEELQPGWTAPLWSLGNIYENAYKDFDVAQSFFERALRIDPDDALTLRNLGRLLKKRGQLDLAREYLNRAVLQDPSDPKTRELLSDLDGNAHE